MEAEHHPEIDLAAGLEVILGNENENCQFQIDERVEHEDHLQNEPGVEHEEVILDNQNENEDEEMNKKKRVSYIKK